MDHTPPDIPGQGTDILLLKLPDRRLDGAALAALRDAVIGATQGCTVQGYAAVDAQETYVYCRLPSPGADSVAATIRAGALALYPTAGVQRLRRLSDLPGASSGRAAPWHYIVETDVVATAEQDLNDWYDQEHLPGLAGVPGTVRAERFICTDGAPRYHACYDLESVETFGSPPWLAVRATAWSDRVRPSFRNTKRTMFKAID
jgi:hypothetical protein